MVRFVSFKLSHAQAQANGRPALIFCLSCFDFPSFSFRRASRWAGRGATRREPAPSAMRVLQCSPRGVQPPPARSTDAARPGPSKWPFLGARWRYARGTASRVASSGESSTHGRIARGHARPPVLCTQRAASARTLDRRRTAGPLEVELAISRGPSWRHLREAMHEAIQPKVQLYSAIHRFLRYIICTKYNL